MATQGNLQEISIHLSKTYRTVKTTVRKKTLEHTSLNGVIGKAKDGDVESRQEREANDFARLFLAPPCILVDNGIYDFENIMKFIGVSEEHAKQAVGEIQQYKRTKKTQTEKELCKKFNTNGYRKLQIAKTIMPIRYNIEGGVANALIKYGGCRYEAFPYGTFCTVTFNN